MLNSSRTFGYRTENPRPALVAGVVLAVVALVAAVLVPITFARILFVSLPVGPLAWALLQWLRSGLGVHIVPELLTVDRQPPRRRKQIALSQIIGWGRTNDDCLIVAYLLPQKAPEPVRQGGGLALADAYPSSPSRPARRLLISLPLNDSAACIAALADVMSSADHAEMLSENELRTLARALRIRTIILYLLALLASPIYVMILARLVLYF